MTLDLARSLRRWEMGKLSGCGVLLVTKDHCKVASWFAHVSGRLFLILYEQLCRKVVFDRPYLLWSVARQSSSAR
jgi:hypothetical protein